MGAFVNGRSPLQTDLNPMEAIQQLAFADDDRHLLCTTMQHYLLLWPLWADARKTYGKEMFEMMPAA